MSDIYDDSSIDMLEGSERVRQRPEVMLGTSGINGTRHTVTEIVGNVLDEASGGFGDKVDITYYKDKSIGVRDYGRGVPLGWNKKYKRWNWDLIYHELYAGGKYGDVQKKLAEVNWNNLDFDQFIKEFNYLFSVGLNGLGGASVQFTSEYFEVKSYRDGKCSKMCFKHGEPVKVENPIMIEVDYLLKGVFDDNGQQVFEKRQVPLDLEITDTDEANGTYVRWLPDKQIFSQYDVGGDWLYNNCKDVLQIAGLTLNFTNKESGFTDTVVSNGLLGLMKRKFKKSFANLDKHDEPIVFTGSNFTHGITEFRGKKDIIYVCKADLILTFVTKGARNYCFHNSTFISDGSPYFGVDRALRDFFNSVASTWGIKLENSDYANLVGTVVSSYSNIASYKGQTKNEVDNQFIEDTIYNTVSDILKQEYGKGNKELAIAIAEVKKEAEARIAIREFAKTQRQVKKMANDKPPDKFVSCKAYDKHNSEIAELWITEGDSAKSSCHPARDRDFQALYPVRGKVLNVLKWGFERIFKSEVIKGLFAILETGMDIGEGLFDISKLRFGKIVLATDADEDGYQIRVLLFLIFYKLAPDLLRKGHVFIAETPLYAVKLTDGSTIYARDKAQLEEKRKEYGNRIVSVNRLKGLGEMNWEVLRETTMNPENRVLVPLVIDSNDRLSQQVIDMLFGQDKGGERKAVLSNILGMDVEELLENGASGLNSLEAVNEDDEIKDAELDLV